MKEELNKLSNLIKIPGGGQKEVFTCLHKDYGKVVLKKIYPKDDSLERTKREIRAVSLMNSNNIPKIYANNCDDDNPNPLCIIEEYISGNNLRYHIQNKRAFGLSEIVKLIETLLSVSIISEKNNLVHRDIKPENIMLDDDGKFWLLDFGIARHLDLESITDSNSPFGLFTIGYASSEQFRNLKKEIDIRADLFSIGVVCYELLQGENFYIKGTNNDVFQIIKKLESSSLPNQRIDGDPQFQLSAFIKLLGDHRRYRRPRNALQAMEIFKSILPTLNLK